jgi:hypothetical protein
LFNHHISGAADMMELMRRARPDVTIIATHERIDTPIRLVADRFLPEPIGSNGMTADAYAKWLLDVATVEGADLVIPYRRRVELARFRELFRTRDIRLMTAADEETMLLLEDKPTLLGRIADAGMPVTPFRLFRGLEGYERLRLTKDLFPDHSGDLCVKPASGIYGAGFRILRERIANHIPFSGLTTQELFEPAFRVFLSGLSEAELMMLMPLLPGPEHSVDFACFDGQLLGTVTREKMRSSQLIRHDQHGEELAALVARTFHLTGILNLQMMNDSFGTPRLLEVNSRMSGGIGMTGLSNVDLAGLLLNAVEGQFPSDPARVSEEFSSGRRECFWAM